MNAAGPGRLLLTALLPVSLLLPGCSSDEPGTVCPVLGDRGPALAADSTYLLVANSLGEDWRAARVDPEGLSLLAEGGLGGHVPNDLDLAGGRAFLVNSGDNTISVVDLATGRTVGCIDAGAGANPWELAVDPGNPRRAFATTFLSGEILELDLERLRVVRRRVVGPAAEGILVLPERIAVTLTGFRGTEGDFGEGSVVFLDKETLAEASRLPVPTNPQFLFPGADGRVHVVCTGNFGNGEPRTYGRVVRIEADGSAVRDTLELGGSPSRAAVAEDGTAYVAAFFGGVTAYDSASFTLLHDASDPLLPEPGYTDVAVEGDRVFLANFDLDAVVVWSREAGAVVDGILVGDGPAALGVKRAEQLSGDRAASSPPLPMWGLPRGGAAFPLRKPGRP